MDGTGAAARFNYPQGVAADGMGNLYIGGSYSSTVRKVVLATGETTTIAGSPGMQGSTDGTGSAALFVRRMGWPWTARATCTSRMSPTTPCARSCSPPER